MLEVTRSWSYYRDIAIEQVDHCLFKVHHGTGYFTSSEPQARALIDRLF